MLRKILIVLPTDNLGGAEKVLKMIARHYINNANVSVFFLQKRTTSLWDDLLINKNITLDYGKSKSSGLGLISLIFFVFKCRKFHYIFSSQTIINGFIGLLIKLRIIQTKFFIARESTTIFNRFSGIKLFKYRMMYYLGYSSIDLLICQTELMKAQFIKNLPFISKKINIKTIPNPINLEKRLQPDTDFIFNQDCIVAAGRLIEEKGFDILIDAFNLLQNDYSNLKLVILGEGPLRSHLETKIRILNLADKVLLPGRVSNVLPYFNLARVCVVSSRIEGFPNVLLEMMSQNTNVVSTKCAGGIDELEGVFVVEVNDVSGLVEHLKVILESDTSHNRILFDKELKSRSINEFINKIEFF
jgi:glycosyltransferase involved in cell wall biosynthesis